MSDDPRSRRDAGSRGIFGVLRHPIAAFTAPVRSGAPATDTDRHAAFSREGVTVSCFLCASFAPFPSGWKQGGLRLDVYGARWAAGIRDAGDGTPLPSPIQVLSTREVESSEQRHLKPRFFQIIETTSDLGDLRLGVPRDSVALVVERLTAK